MRSAMAVFKKQARDTLKNRMVLMQFIIFPVMALIMTQLVAKANNDIPDNIFVTMFAAMFAGMTPLTMTASAIAEDKEKKSLRFLIMAGVKPHEYIIGVGGFVLFASAVVAVLFALIGGFGVIGFIMFVAVLLLGSAASLLLGGIFGMISRNQQSAVAMAMPVAMIFAFLPMLAQFDGDIKGVANILFSQQVNEIVSNDIAAGSAGSIAGPLLIILANIVVFLVLFTVAYRKKGLKG